MKAFSFKYLTLVVILIFTTCFTWAQTKSPSQSGKTKQELTLEPGENSIKHVFQIELSKKDCKKLSKLKKLEKNYLSSCKLIYNNDTLPVNEIELRGKSSMLFKRKSFSIKLDKKKTFTKNQNDYKLKKFNLISLSMDQNYYRNKVAFDLMSHLGLFSLFYDYAEVVINGKSQGVYLMLQKPKNYAFKKENASVMLRRDYQNVIKKTYYKGDDTTMKFMCEKTFLSIYNEIMEKEGQDFYEELSKVLDTDQYFTWMAFNYLIGNKDYTDEVFFFNKVEENNIMFGIIPWDYDDIFFDTPREGYLVRYINFGDRLAFSSEDDLDYKIIKDNYSYNKYLEVLATVTEKVSTDLLIEVFQQTYQELYPFYCRKDIIKTSKSDRYGKTDLNKLQMDMQNNFAKIIQKREETASLVNSKSTKISDVNLCESTP